MNNKKKYLSIIISFNDLDGFLYNQDYLIKKLSKNYKNNQKVIILAKKVAEQANEYRKQLSKCQKRLNKNKYIIF